MRIEELFTVPEGEKITEKAFSRVLISSICSILLCMACLLGTTWAWFTVDIENQGNAIQIANVTASIQMDGAEKMSDGSFSVPAGSYTIDIQLNGDAAAADALSKPLSDVYVVMTVTREGAAESYYFTFHRQSGEMQRQQEFQVAGGAAKVSFSVSWVRPAAAAPLDGAPVLIGEPEVPSGTETTPPTEAPTENTIPPTENPTEAPTEPLTTEPDPTEPEPTETDPAE